MRRILVIGGLVLVLLGAVDFFVQRWDFTVDQPPVDFELNWVAAHRLVDREPVYDRAASRADGFRLIGPGIIPDFSHDATYASYIGTPATALLYVPFTAFDHDSAAALYRWTQALLMVVAIAITGFAVPRRSRLPVWLVGAAAFFWFYPVQESIGLGQVDGFIMVALAVAYWATVRDRWRVVGVALGIATLLKISPGLLLVYLVVRGRRKVVVPAVLSAAGLLGAAVVVGRPGDIVTWTTDVLPKLSRGGLLINNQSFPAWMARLWGDNLDWLDLNAGLGVWRPLAPVIALGGIGLVWWIRRDRPLVVLEPAVIVFFALLAGPISWDHYPTWIILSLMLMADPGWWEGRGRVEVAVLGVLLAGGTVLMHKLTLYARPEVIAADWTRRVESGSKTVGLGAYLAVALWLLWRPPPASGAPTAGSGDPESAPTLTDDGGAQGLHTHG